MVRGYSNGDIPSPTIYAAPGHQRRQLRLSRSSRTRPDGTINSIDHRPPVSRRVGDGAANIIILNQRHVQHPSPRWKTWRHSHRHRLQTRPRPPRRLNFTRSAPLRQNDQARRHRPRAPATPASPRNGCDQNSPAPAVAVFQTMARTIVKEELYDPISSPASGHRGPSRLSRVTPGGPDRSVACRPESHPRGARIAEGQPGGHLLGHGRQPNHGTDQHPVAGQPGPDVRPCRQGRHGPQPAARPGTTSGLLRAKGPANVTAYQRRRLTYAICSNNLGRG